jgi:hypothetical protein
VPRPPLPRGSTSQLAFLTEQASAAGLECIKADLLQQEEKGETLGFKVDISHAAATGSDPQSEPTSEGRAPSSSPSLGCAMGHVMDQRHN